MSKSRNRKIKEIQGRSDKKAERNPKRLNKRRGEHGCARLRALREDDVNVEIPKTKTGFVSKIKGFWRK